MISAPFDPPCPIKACIFLGSRSLPCWLSPTYNLKKKVCGRCGKEHADQNQCTAAAHCINCKGDHPAFSNQCPKFLEEQAILRYRAEHGGTFQQARAAVIVETPRSVSSRTYAQALRPSQKPKETAQPKASDKVTASVTSKANAQRHTPPSCPIPSCR